MTEEPRARRASKKPAWLLDNVDPTAADVDGEQKPRVQHKRSSTSDSIPRTSNVANKQHASEKLHRPDMPRRMCLNPACKSPFESPQWRRGPLGPGTLCNACGTRYARIEAKKRGDKKGASKLRPQDLAEWQAFEEQLQHPPDIQQAWRAHTSRLVTQLQRLQRREQLEAAAQGYDDAADEQQYEYDDECEDGDDEQQHPTRGPDSDYGQDEELQGQQGSQAHENLSSYRAGTGSAAAAAGRFSGLGRSRQQQHSDELQQSAGKGSPCADAQQQPYPEQLGRVKRRQRRCDEDASDSQEAAACSYQESEETGLSNGSRHAHAAPGDGGLGTAGDHFLHLLAVGEAMIKTEGVAPEDRKEAWEQYVEKCLPAEQHNHQARAADTINVAKRSRFKAEAEERQGGRSEQLPGNLPVPPKDRFERLLAEAEQCIRARSASPLLRPITPQFEVLADGSRAIQSGSADAAAAAGASSAADKSPLPRVSRLGDAGRQVGAQGLFPPHLELPAAATTATTVAGSRLCAGGLLGTSAAAACKSSAGGHSNRLEELQQRCLQQDPADSDGPDSKLLLTDEELEVSPGAAEQPLTQQQQQQRMPLAAQQPSQQQMIEQLQQRLQLYKQQLAQSGSPQRSSPQVALLKQLQSTEWLQSALRRLLSDPGLCTVLACCLSDPEATSWLMELLQGGLQSG